MSLICASLTKIKGISIDKYYYFEQKCNRERLQSITTERPHRDPVPFRHSNMELGIRKTYRGASSHINEVCFSITMGIGERAGLPLVRERGEIRERLFAHRERSDDFVRATPCRQMLDVFSDTGPRRISRSRLASPFSLVFKMAEVQST